VAFPANSGKETPVPAVARTSLFGPAGLVSQCNLKSSSVLDESSVKYHYFHNTTYKSLFTDHALKRLIATNFWKIS